MEGVVYYRNFTGDLCKLKATDLDAPDGFANAIEDTHEYLNSLDGLDSPPRTVLITIKGGKA